MYFNLETVLNKKIDLNPKQIVCRSLTPMKNELNKDMKLIERPAKDDETPDSWVAGIMTTNPNIMFSMKFDKYEEAEVFLRKFKEDL